MEGICVRRRATGIVVPLMVFMLMNSIFALGCQTTIGNVALMARPAIAVPPRSIEINDGGEQVYVEKYRPEGDSLFIFIRFFPKEVRERQMSFPAKIKSLQNKTH